MVPLPAARGSKPRRSGLAGDFADLAKIKTGTARLYPERLLGQKLKRYRRHRIQPFLGGQFHGGAGEEGQAEPAHPGFDLERIEFGKM